jgi:hypothetical protein
VECWVRSKILCPQCAHLSARCIMLELFTKKPVFQGSDEIHQLDTIYRVIGTPTPDRWSDVANLPWYELVKPRDEIPNHFRELFRKWVQRSSLTTFTQCVFFSLGGCLKRRSILLSGCCVTIQPPVQLRSRRWTPHISRRKILLRWRRSGTWIFFRTLYTH